MNKEENVTQEPETAGPAQGGEPQKNSAQEAACLGKFKSVDALVRAYTELEAEFTRRSQRLKALEEAAAPQCAALPEQGEPAGGTAHGENTAAGAERGSEELYRAASGNEEVRMRIFRDALASMKSVPLMAGGGSSLTAPPEKPRSIAEAGALALGYLRSRGR